MDRRVEASEKSGRRKKERNIEGVIQEFYNFEIRNS